MARQDAPAIAAKAPAPIIIKLWNGAYIKIVDQRGKGGDIVSLARDITETVEYQRKLVDARATAEAANSAKSLFLAKMSHEIRTPMNGIVGMTEVLGDTALTQDQRLYVDTIKTSGEALLVIINDVLDFSRIEANRLSIHPAPFDLERVFQEVLLLLQPLAVQRGWTSRWITTCFCRANWSGMQGVSGKCLPIWWEMLLSLRKMGIS